jgi:hypothetical protein
MQRGLIITIDASRKIVLGYRRKQGGVFETLLVTLGYFNVPKSIGSHLIEVPSHICQY